LSISELGPLGPYHVQSNPLGKSQKSVLGAYINVVISREPDGAAEESETCLNDISSHDLLRTYLSILTS
jgi:hypothetical protein